MESKVKILGHPVHPMLIVFPVGLFATAVIFDILYLSVGNRLLAAASFYMIAAGVLGGLTAALFGLLDWLALPQGSRAKTLGGWHGLGNVTLVALFASSWFLRLNNDDFLPGALALALSFAGALLALFTAWLGGELVYRLGVGVDRNANVDAPNSLRQESAEAPAARRSARR